MFSSIGLTKDAKALLYKLVIYLISIVLHLDNSDSDVINSLCWNSVWVRTWSVGLHCGARPPAHLI